MGQYQGATMNDQEARQAGGERRQRCWFNKKATIVGLALLSVVILWAGAADATVKVTRVTGNYAGELYVPINKSQVLETDVPFGRVSVGSAEIADVLPLTDRTVYVLGKKIGLTNLTVYGKDDRPIAVLDIVVTYDVKTLKARLFELYPRERIEIHNTAGSILLTGRVTDAATMQQVLAVAQQYAPGKVTNLLSVHGSQQVMLAVRFAEVSRSLSRQLGVEPSITAGGNPSFVFFPFLSGIQGFTGLLSGSSGDFSLDITIKALEAKGLVKTLAEPNLIAMSGDTASFLAGGEFPVPVAQQAATTTGAETGTVLTGAITVEFKQFGVGLSFTPTVLADSLINLAVNAEVSSLDTSTQAGAVESAGFNIPALVTRRADTTVELRDGQSFAIAGLFQNNFTDNVNQLPWIGNVPVLGALFRSTDFLNNQTELVIMVTPHLVAPADAASMAVPTDSVAEPSDIDLFFFGHTEGPKFPTAKGHAAPPQQLMQRPADGGFSGDHGYIIE